MLKNRALAAVAAAVVLLAPVAGCGGSDGKDTAGKSAGKNSDSSSPGAPSTLEPAAFIKKLGDAMQAKRTARLELELGSSISADAQVDYGDGTGTEMAMKMVTGGQTVQVVLADGTMYLQQTKGQKYLKIDKSDPALGNLLKQVSSVGPRATLEGLEPGVTKVEEKGTETVDGLELTHYVLKVDSAKVKENFGALTQSVKLPKTVSYDVYVDPDFLLRQLRITLSGQKLVMKASDWGKPVTITVPPASQVVKR